LGLLLVRADRRSPEEAHAVERLLAQHADLRRAATLLDGFARLIRERTDEPDADERLARWEAEALDAGMPELAAFVARLRQDRAAVLAALTLAWSQGQAEGQVNRLKSSSRSWPACAAARSVASRRPGASSTGTTRRFGSTCDTSSATSASPHRQRFVDRPSPSS
jgi:Transposase